MRHACLHVVLVKPSAEKLRELFAHCDDTEAYKWEVLHSHLLVDSAATAALVGYVWVCFTFSLSTKYPHYTFPMQHVSISTFIHSPRCHATPPAGTHLCSHEGAHH